MSEKHTEVLAPHVRAAPSPERLAPGAVVGSWRLVHQIAVGGCGVVYAARHTVLDRLAAVKVLHAELASSPVMVDRFLREARAVNAIRHPNIVDIFDFGTVADGRPYFVMELLAPGDLEQRVAASGRLLVPEVVAILTPICHALAAAHRAGYIHRDLKARNIGFAPGVDGAPKLLDFGIAKLLEDDRDGATATLRVGTPYCMAPEQIRGERVEARTDVYALGVLLHHLLTGRYPFDAADPAEIERLHLEATPPPPSRLAPVPAELDALVARALAKAPADRPTVAELLAALTAAVPGAPVQRDAVAIHLAIELPAELDDDHVDRAALAADRAATQLADAGFAPVIATGTSVLAARLIDHARPQDGPAVIAAARALAAALGAELARAQLAARTRVHPAAVELAASGALVGGPLLDLHRWPRSEP